jgi:ACS family D-galactonate transporter-like MFS transporter
MPMNSSSAAMHSATRFRILALISVGTMINYLDRTVLGIAAPSLALDLHISPAAMGMIFSAFSWSYAAGQIPGGWLLDRIGTRLTYFLAVTFWSLFTLVQGFAGSVAALVAFRLGLGISEAPCFPTNGRVVATWFREHERAQATAMYTVGEYLGLACFGPLLFWVSRRLGWRPLFWIVGAAGLVFAAFWWVLYRDPESCGPAPNPVRAVPVNWAQIRRLLRYRQVWGASIGQFGGNSTLVFFLTWFPTYLAKERHMDWMRAGFYSILPFLAAACGVLLGGWASDTLLRRTGSRNLARKAPLIAGLFGASTIILANYVTSDALVIAIFSVAFFFQGMTGLGWTVISDIAPVEMLGITGGIFSFAANLAGVATPIVIGAIIGATGSFYYALAYIGAAALLGAFSYTFLIGDIERIVLEPSAPAASTADPVC